MDNTEQHDDAKTTLTTTTEEVGKATASTTTTGSAHTSPVRVSPRRVERSYRLPIGGGGNNNSHVVPPRSISSHAMIDIETLGTSLESVVVSIGATAFDIQTGTLFAEHYSIVDRDSCVAIGLRVDPNNLEWWKTQPSEVRSVTEAAGRPIRDCLLDLSRFVTTYGCTKVWFYGPEFDESILRLCYERLKIDAPWKYWDVMCARTLDFIVPESRPDRTTPKHNALYDARYQMAAVISAHHYLAAWRARAMEQSPWFPTTVL